jgi:hypothetical protein
MRAWIAALGVLGCATVASPRPFADRPVAWEEHDDEDVPRPGSSPPWEKTRLAHSLREGLMRGVDDKLALRQPRPAEDVNALDEVPCSTWFCPRNHLRRMAPEDVAAGPPGVPPRLPLTIVKMKEAGAAAGATVVDARGHKFLLKVDPKPWTRLMVGAELVSSRLFWAAGYNVPPAWAVELGPNDLAGKASEVRRLREAGAVTREGRLSAVATAWIDGEIVGGFDFKGRRPDDPNDRIPHQDRRSLRGSWVVYAWTNYQDASTANTVDSWIEEGGRRFVRHYIVDFGSTLGAWTISPKPPRLGHKSMLVALTGTDPQRRWARALKRYPAVGWLEADGWRPASFKTLLRNPAHQARQPADEYWGAKVVTSFTDEQIAAAVASADYSATEAAELVRAMGVRRDLIGRAYLAPATAIEDPSRRGPFLCFRDLAIERGYAEGVVYRLRWRDERGRLLSSARAPAAGPTSCLPAETTGYRILEVQSGTRPARIHLKDGRIVGLEHE